MLGLLFLLAVVVGGRSALSGMRTILEPILPGAAAAPESQAHDSARLELFGFGAVPVHYTPQVLFPVHSQAMPDWLRLRLMSGLNLPPLLPSPPAPVGPGPAIAICIDDLGEDLARTDRAIALPKNVTLAFLPYAESTPFLAQEAERKGHQVLAHVPMEAIGHPDPGPMSLRVGSPDIAGRLAWNIARVPGLSGINNHEGSKFSTDAASLIPVMETLSVRHLFYFDSRTISGSQGIRVAHMFGVMSGGRDIFLDDTISEAEVRQQLADLVAEAQHTGVAIAIGHPHDVTLNILAAWLAQDHGVRLVPVSEAIKLKTEHAAVMAAE
ncbi:MAG TPA: divergent polysaccharide deacetylase family protein [Rhizomicrobium sp.]|nr:divergent polysaccharide deacetylase family protein [Rhizomicrobium sp.]